jgi:gamma-glutamyltranspeptidase / glutathione hydrolase
MNLDPRKLDPMPFRFSPGRGPAVAASCMAATSQPLATLAALDVLRRGGNAIDAAISAAAVLCVAEPYATGIGGDAFALVHADGECYALDAAGPAPMTAPRVPVPSAGADSAVVPGAVSGWQALSDRFGRWGLDSCLAYSIDAAENGVAAGFHASNVWRGFDRAPAAFGRAPRVGEVFTLPDLAASLRAIAEGGASAFYAGDIARAISAASWLEESDLSEFTGAKWVDAMRIRYRGVEVIELPPPTQGIAALEGLALLNAVEPTLVNTIRCVALALEDARRATRDGADVSGLVTEEFVKKRLQDVPQLQAELSGGTTYLSVVDDDGMAVSLIQSLFEPFGSGVVAPGTGILLNNRAKCFSVGGEVIPGRRPYHTTIPGMLQKGRTLVGSFGVVGGFIQAQAHVQLVSALVDDGLDPQAALDRPRFRTDNGRLHLEEGLWSRADELSRAGFDTVLDDERIWFGGGQAILVESGRILGGSDPRMDGFAAGF